MKKQSIYAFVVLAALGAAKAANVYALMDAGTLGSATDDAEGPTAMAD